MNELNRCGFDVNIATKQLATRFLTTEETSTELRENVTIRRTLRRALPGIADEHTLVEVLDKS